jgi:hypothetical protein
MKAKLAVVVLKWAVKYLRNHPDLIPGHIDDSLIKVLASVLGV